MSWFDGVRATVRGWVLRGREDRELKEELEYHLERSAEEHVRNGMTAGEGRRAARLQLGSVDRFHEEVRDARGARLWDDVVRDVGFAVRNLRRAPAFTGTALVTIALGVGATTAIFSVLDGVVLRPLPYANGDRLVSIWGRFLPESGFDFPTFPLSPPEYFDYRATTRTLEDVAAYRRLGVTLVRGDAAAQRIEATAASANLFSVLGVQPALGRFYRAEEDVPGGPSLAVLGHGFWRGTFGGDPSIVGRTIRLNGVETEVVGVLPPGITFPDADRAIYLPLQLNASEPGSRMAHYLTAIGVLSPQATLEEAAGEMDVLMARWKAEYPDVHTGHFLYLNPRLEEIVGGVRPVLFVLLGAVGFVLLIACANVANVLLARGEVRARELAVRRAIGAGHGRIIRQLLTESAVLAVAGGLAGAVLARLSLGPLLALGDGSIPRAEAVAVDGRVLGFTLGVTLLCSLLFGVAPALRASAIPAQEVLRGGGRSTTARRRLRLRRTLVATQVALAFLVVTGAGLMIRSLRALMDVDPGMDPAGVLVAEVSLPAADYPEPERVIAFDDALLARIRALPGVVAATATATLPLTGTSNVDFALEGTPPPGPGEPAHSGDVLMVAPGFLATFDVPLVAGRFFEPADRADAVPVAVVNETFARMFFPGETPLGHRMRLGQEQPWLTIVGVVGDVRYAALDAEQRPGYYIPIAQTTLSFTFPARTLAFALRTGADPATLAPHVRAAVRELDANLPIIRLATMKEVVGESVARPRFLTTLLTLFAALAATIGAIGLYGLLAYTVAQRARDFAIRLALGAGAKRVFGRVLREGLLLAAGGIALGVVGALATVRVISSQLYGVQPRDPLTFAAVAGGLLLVALVACAVPALRAIRVPPLNALRGDG